VLADARDDSDLVAETDLAALLRLHKEDPEVCVCVCLCCVCVSELVAKWVGK